MDIFLILLIGRLLWEVLGMDRKVREEFGICSTELEVDHGNETDVFKM